MGFHDWFAALKTGERLSHYLRMIGHQQHCVMERNMAKLNIAAAQHRILGILQHRPAMSQKEIADFLEVSTPTITTTLKKMEKSGYIERAMDPRDNRVNKVAVTPLGNEIFIQGIEMMRVIDREMMKGFTEEELQTFLSLAKRCHERLIEMNGIDYERHLKEKGLLE